MFDIVVRKSWDVNIKELKIYESAENSAVFKIWLFSPIFFISERDTIDKRIDFMKDDAYYYFSSSVDNYSEVNPDVVRCLTLINSVILKEDEENVYYHSLTQIDIKVYFELS